jgi:hypothetical protein
MKFEKDRERKGFLENRDIIRLNEEKYESLRRRNVLDGKWTE